MDKRLTVLVVLILSLLISIPSFFCGWLMSERTREISQTTNIAIGQNDTTDKININKASKVEIDTLTGIGDSKADSITSNRPYKNIYELLDKGIIGKDTFEKIKNQIKVGGN